jgi:hypothetical protein
VKSGAEVRAGVHPGAKPAFNDLVDLYQPSRDLDVLAINTAVTTTEDLQPSKRLLPKRICLRAALAVKLFVPLGSGYLSSSLAKEEPGYSSSVGGG